MLIAFATLAGVLITLFGIYIGQRVGLLQISIPHKEHDLNLLKSAPVIDTAVRIIERQINPAPAFAPFYYIVTTINNYGELAAQQLNGHWRLYSPDHSIQQHNIPIVRNALGSAPYEFEPCRLEGPMIERAMTVGDCKITINVDIEFDYLGLSKDQPQHYSASYHNQYDRDSRQMIQITGN